MHASRVVGVCLIFLGVIVFLLGLIVSPHTASMAEKTTGNFQGHMGLFLLFASLIELAGFLVALIGGRGKPQ